MIEQILTKLYYCNYYWALRQIWRLFRNYKCPWVSVLSSIRFNQWGFFFKLGKFGRVIFLTGFISQYRSTHINKKESDRGKNILLIQDGMRQEKCPKNNNPPTPYSELWGIFISDTPILASLYGGESHISQVLYTAYLLAVTMGCGCRKY